MTSPPSVIAQTPLFADNFDDDNANGWIVVYNTCLYDGLPATWVVLNKMYGIKINGGNCQTNTIYDLNYVPLNIEYSFEVDMTLTSTSMDRNFLFKYLDEQNRYGLHLIGNMVYLELVVDGEHQDIPASYPFQDNGTYHFEVNLLHDKIVVYINNTVVHSHLENSITAFPNSRVGLRASAGAIPSSEVWFDNMEVKILGLVPTPTPTSSPLPTPTPTPQPFELPVSYVGRAESNEGNFTNAFWDRLTAAFDHNKKSPFHFPFDGNRYSQSDCPVEATGVQCYNSHNGTDFDDIPDTDVFSVAEGEIVYASDEVSGGCPNEGGFGCSIIAQYDNTIDGTLYGLYAHLSAIDITEGDPVSEATKIGDIGNTGCDGCGTHLHFGVLKEGVFTADLLTSQTSTPSAEKKKQMGKEDWQALLYEIRPEATVKVDPPCSYSAPNGMVFTFQDPSGWNPFFGGDAWSAHCGVSSPYLWKYFVGYWETESSASFLQPIEDFLGI